ncbi:MAG: hypothetical protein ACFFDK_01525 [Promethearchaeota archaeon]
MNKKDKVKELEQKLTILEDIKKLVENKCTGFELADLIAKISPKFQQILETNLISIDTAKMFKSNPFCAEEKDTREVDFQLFKKFEAFVWNLNKLFEDTKFELINLQKN